MYKKFIKRKLLLGSLVMVAVFGLVTLWPRMAKATVEAGLITSPVTSNMWSGVKNITWDASKCSTVTETMDITYSTDGYNYSSNIISSVVCSAGSYAWNTSNVSNGSNYTIRIYRNGGSVFATSGIFTIDNTAPTLTVSDGVSLTPVKTDTISFETTDSLSGVKFVGYAIKVGSESCNSITNYTVVISPFNISGDHVTGLCMKVTDNAGNVRYEDLGLLHTDNTGPIVDAGSDIITNNPFTRTASTSDTISGVSTYVWSATSPNVTFSSPNTLTTGISASSDGVYEITLTVTDNAGNSNSDTFQLTWDTTSPAVSATTPVADMVYTSGDLEFTASDFNGLNKCEYSVNNGDYQIADCTTKKVAVSSLSDGRQTIKYKVTDNAGNLAETSNVSFVVNKDGVLTVGVSPADFTTIQGAINASVDGNTILVSSGIYAENIIINKDLTLVGTDLPVITSTTGTTVTIQHDGVTVDGFDIKNIGSGNGIISTIYNNISIINNKFSDITNTTGETAQAIAIVPGSTNVDNINILGNTFDKVYGTKSTKAIAIGWSNGTADLTGLVISGNTINNITSTAKGAYGILINHGSASAATGKTIGAKIYNNNITNLVGINIGAWAHAIGLEGKTPEIEVKGNIIYSITGGLDSIGIYFEDNDSASTAKIESNQFSNVLAGIARNASTSGTGDINAAKNWWNTNGGPIEATNPTGQNVAVGPGISFAPWCLDSACTNFGAAPTDLSLTGTPSSFTNSQSINISVAGQTVVAYKYKIDSGAFSSPIIKTTVIASSTLAEGAHTISVLGRDQAGNWMTVPVTYSWTVDLTVPTFTIDNGTEPGPVKTDLIKVTVTDTNIDTAGSYYGFSADGICDSSDTISTAFTSGTEFSIAGDHTDYLCVKSTDKAGNIAYSSVGKLNIDNTAPTLISVGIVSNNANTSLATVGDTVTLTFVSNESIQGLPVVKIMSQGAVVTETTSFTDKMHWIATYTLTSADTSNGVIPFTIDFKDIAGNNGAQVGATTNSSSVVYDNTAPTATISISPATIYDGALTVVVTTTYSEPMLNTAPTISFAGASSTFTSVGTGTWDSSKKIWTQSFTATDENEEKNATVTVSSAKDEAGNTQTVNTQSFAIDTLNPTISGSVTISTSNANSIRAKVGDTITLNFSTSENVQKPTVTIAGKNATVSGLNTSWSATYKMTSAETEGAISYAINFKDLVGNDATGVASTSAIIFDKTSALISLDSILSDNASTTLAKVGDEITLTFSTNEEVTLGAVKIAGAEVGATLNESTNKYIATYIMQSGDTEGMISYEINVSDLAGNTSQKVKASAENTVKFDKTGAVISLESITSDNSNDNKLAKVGDEITLTFSTNEEVTLGDVKIAGHSVAASETEVKNKYTATYIMQSDDAEGMISYEISVSDSAGNASSKAKGGTENTVNFDKTAPVITNLTPTNGEQSSDTTPRISAGFLESLLGSGIDTDTAILELDGTDISVFSSVNPNGISYQPISNLEDGIHSATVKISDNAGNVSEQSIWMFEIAATAKSLGITTDKVSVFADGSSRAKLTVQVLNAGLPVSGGNVCFTNTMGTLRDGNLDELEGSCAEVNGNGLAIVYITSGEAGNAIVNASYDFSGETKTGSVNVQFIDTVKTVTLTASPTSILADGTASSVVSARVFSNGILMEDAVVAFSTDLGDLNNITDTSASISSTVPGTANVTATFNTGSELITKTIQIVLISADTTKPTAVTNPSDNAINVPITIHPVITFSEKMKESLLTNSKIKLYNYNSAIEVPSTLQVETVDDVTAVTIIPNSPLEKDTQYYFTISTVEDLAGNQFNPTWTSSSKSSHEFKTKKDITSYEIGLNSGWNLISLPLIPQNSNIDAVLAGITDIAKVEIVKSYDSITGTWLSYVPAAETGNLTSMEDGKGYWVKMTEGGALNISGTQNPSAEVTPRSYPIVGNTWNLIGFKSTQTMGVSEYITEIGNTDVVWKYDQDGYSSVYNNIYKDGVLNPGRGYWLFAHANAYSIVPSGY